MTPERWQLVRGILQSAMDCFSRALSICQVDPNAVGLLSANFYKHFRKRHFS
jgi:hypothetical protein